MDIVCLIYYIDNMTKLKIQQGDSVENTSSAVVDKLYRLALSIQGNDIQLTGNIQTSAAYEDAVKYLAGKIGTALNSQGRFEGLTITVLNDNYYIRFADEQVEPVLIAAGFSSDGIGISKRDVDTISLGSQLFKDNTDLNTLNELNQFRNLSLGGECFSGCTNLTSIDLSTVKSIGSDCFIGCSNLDIDVSVPNLVSLNSGAFKQSYISSVSNLGSITTIPRQCFQDCSNLQSVTLPNIVSEFYADSFNNCSNLVSIDGIQNGNSIELSPSGSVFRGCTSLKSIGCNTFTCGVSSGNPVFAASMFSNCQQLEGELNFIDSNLYVDGSDYYCHFLNCKKLTKITLSHINRIGGGSQWSGNERGMFTGCSSLKVVDLGDSINLIEARYSFRGCSSLQAVIIRNTVPPNICPNDVQSGHDITTYTFSDMFGPSFSCKLYVPDSAVDTYKAATWFSTVQDKILPLSQYDETAIFGN